MSTIGRAIRDQQRAATEMAIADRQTRYPVLTGENALEAIAYQEERIAHHLETTRKRS